MVHKTVMVRTRTILFYLFLQILLLILNYVNTYIITTTLAIRLSFYDCVGAYNQLKNASNRQSWASANYTAQ